MSIILSIVFVLSGAAGLLYESIWSRYLGLFVGHSAYAQVLVLVIFLGGMSAGSWLTARLSRRLAEPLLAYAAVEALVGVMGLVFHDAYLAITTWAYQSLFPNAPGDAMAMVAKWGIGALLILPQSLLLGATFPLMSAGLLRRLTVEQSGRSLAVLYGANSFGAAVGVLIAGFVLLPLVGLPGTVLTAALTNMVCAIAVFLLVRSPMGVVTAASEHAADVVVPVTVSASARPSRDRRWRAILLATAFGTAIASFVYEVAWVRMLSLVLGSATHSFELMLSAFILGLAIGAWWIRTRIDRWEDRAAMLVRIQIVMAVLAACTVVLYLQLFDVMAAALAALARTEAAYQLFAVFRYAMCLAVMLPATICAGMTLPLITRMLAESEDDEAAIGQVYAVNTVGSIIGAILASLVLMPWIGLRMLLLFGAAVDLFCAYVLAWGAPRRAPARGWQWSFATATLIVFGLMVSTRFDPLVLGSGVFRTGQVTQAASTRMLSYQDGRTASVSVFEGGPAARRKRSIATNGKPDASLAVWWLDTNRVATGEAMLTDDEATQALLPLITLAHRPSARRAAVIGQGSGMSSHFLLGSPRLESLATIEIEPAMIAASRAFYPANRRVFDDPRSRFIVDDARSIFAGAPRGFDLIMSEPSNPWVSGVSGLFTEEFYARVRQTLAPGGVFGQWMHLYEMSDALLVTVLRALYAEFPAFRIYRTNSMDILIVATVEDHLNGPDWDAVMSMPGIRQDVRAFRPIRAEHIDGAMVATSQELAPLLAAPYGRNSDYFPLLDHGAEQARFLGRMVQGFSDQSGASARFDVFAALGARRSSAGGMAGPLLIPRLVQTFIATQVRAERTGAVVENSELGRQAREAVRREQVLELELQLPIPPVDWVQWLETVRAADAIWNGAQAGRADSAIFRQASAYAVRHTAPAMVLQALHFELAAATWDWPGAVVAGKALAEARVATGTRWVNEDYLRDVLVVALLKTRRVAEATAVFEKLAPYSARTADDLRSQLLAAYLEGAAGP